MHREACLETPCRARALQVSENKETLVGQQHKVTSLSVSRAQLGGSSFMAEYSSYFSFCCEGTPDKGNLRKEVGKTRWFVVFIR